MNKHTLFVTSALFLLLIATCISGQNCGPKLDCPVGLECCKNKCFDPKLECCSNNKILSKGCQGPQGIQGIQGPQGTVNLTRCAMRQFLGGGLLIASCGAGEFMLEGGTLCSFPGFLRQDLPFGSPQFPIGRRGECLLPPMVPQLQQQSFFGVAQSIHEEAFCNVIVNIISQTECEAIFTEVASLLE